jgi:type IV pilus assembly protein PilQ
MRRENDKGTCLLKGHWIQIFFWILGWLVILHVETSCTTVQKSAQPKTPEAREIQNIEVKDSPDVTEIRVESNQPAVYTAYQLSDPLRLVLDLTGEKLGKYNEEISVNQGAVLSIRPSEGEPPNDVSRLEIGLSQLTDFRIESEGDTLVVKINKPFQEASTETTVTPAPVETSAPAMENPVPAKNLTGVRVEPQETGIDVIVTGDGALSPEVFVLKGNRLVADFGQATNRVKPNVMNVNHPLLKRIRLGQHSDPKKVRLVMDLNKEVTYEVEKKGSEAVIKVTPAAGEGAASAETGMSKEKAPAEQAQEAAVVPPTAPTAVQKTTIPAVRRQEVELGPKRYTGRRISLDFQDADISNVLRLIADVSGLNIVLGEEAKGKITLKLQNVPWDQALDIILKTKGLGQLREGNIIRVDTNGNIAKQQDEEAKAKESLIKAEDLSTRIIAVNYSKAQSLSGTLKKSLSPRGDIMVEESTNTLIIKDISKNLDEVGRLVKILDRQTPQVLIEARIVVANTNFARDLGVQWGAAAANQTGNNRFGIFAGPAGNFGSGTNVMTPPEGPPTELLPASGFAVNLPASGTAGPLGNLGFTFGKFVGRPVTLDLRISAGETTGNTKLLSSPKVVTLDNKEATIQQGESIPFETVSQSGTQTQFIDATLNLTVTPHITPDGSVIMKIKATKNAIGTFRSARTGAPSIDKREATTEVLVKDGETTVLGGILETSLAKTIEGVPWLKNIPILGWLFKRQSTTETNNELLIFITPTIVKS